MLVDDAEMDLWSLLEGCDVAVGRSSEGHRKIVAWSSQGRRTFVQGGAWPAIGGRSRTMLEDGRS